MTRGAYIKVAVGLLVLSLQVFAVMQQHLGPTRYFAWAPNDYIVQYQLQVKVGEQQLTGDEIRHRYHNLYGAAPSSTAETTLAGTFEFPPQQLIDELRLYEQSYGRRDHAQVTLSYRLDGRPLQTWRYPN